MVNVCQSFGNEFFKSRFIRMRFLKWEILLSNGFPASASICLKIAATLFPENIPFRHPVRVMPICSDDISAIGDSTCERTPTALLFFFLQISFCAEINAIPSNAKTSFCKICT